MPRKSAEAISSELFRAAPKLRGAPSRLNSTARQIWKEIVEDRPADWFRAGNWELLEQYCAIQAQQRGCLDAIAKLDPLAKEYNQLLRAVARLSSTSTTLATKLRLTVQWDVGFQSRKTGEKGEVRSDPLLGGVEPCPEEDKASSRVVPIASRRS